MKALYLLSLITGWLSVAITCQLVAVNSAVIPGAVDHPAIFGLIVALYACAGVTVWTAMVGMVYRMDRDWDGRDR